MNRKRIKEDEEEKLLKLEIFDKNDPLQFMMKILFICGTYFGLRGGKEHTDLMVDNFHTSFFPLVTNLQVLVG